MTPRTAPATQRPVKGLLSTTLSMTAEARGAEPMDTTVPIATPARCMDE